MKKQFISNIEGGDTVHDQFAVKFKKPPVEYKGKKGQWFEFRASDKTGEISIKYWGDQNTETTNSMYNSFEKGDVVLVRGVATEYPRGSGNLQISIDASTGEIRKCKPGEYKLSDFIAETEKDVDEMLSELQKFMKGLDNPDLNSLLDAFFSDETFVKEFRRCPAAIHRHQNYIGGLLEHTLNVTKICERIYELNPKLDRDLLLAGAILHDIGKIKEFEVNTSIDISREGMLLGHVVIGEKMLTERINGMKDFPSILKLKLSHILLSHHGKEEYGSPKIPQFPEAIAVYHADELDAKVEYAIRIKEEARTEDPWAWSKDFGHIYLE